MFQHTTIYKNYVKITCMSSLPFSIISSLDYSSWEKMLQKLNQEFLLNLVDRLTFEIEIRYMVYEGRSEEEDQWFQPMYLIPYWNIIEKIKKFEEYFDELGIHFPTFDVYRQPIELSTVFPPDMIHTKEEEFIFKDEKIKVEYRYI